MEKGLFRGMSPVVLSTQPDDPPEGRTFVWGWTEWFERIEGESGNVSFIPVSDYEQELHKWIHEQGLPELTEIDDDFSRDVKEEFLDQVPLYPGIPELSDDEPFEEQNPQEDVEHLS